VAEDKKVSAQEDHNDVDEELPWWRFDFTMILVLVLVAVLLLVVTFEIWIPHS
jgi:hypothetical protein